MFSRIPTPNIDWKPENMKYMLCGFPIVGAVIGLLLWGWTYICWAVGFGPLIRAAGFTVIPIAVSGGIHLEGFLDASDALASRAEPERKRQIMKDSHIGAFAAIGLGIYLLLFFAFSCELIITPQSLLLLSLAPVISRCMSGLTVIYFPSSKNEGLFRSFKETADKTAAAVFLFILALAVIAIMLFELTTAAVIMLLLIFGNMIALFFMSRKQFGGMSGDLAGWFLSMAELLMLIGLTTIMKVLV